MSIQRDLYVFLGPPGSGKGSLSQLCIQKFGWVQLSTGNLCRKHIAEGTQIGQQIDFAIKSGKLVSDALITDMVVQWLLEQPEAGQAIILDGYPRTLVQAQELHKLLQDKPSYFKLNVVRLLVEDETVIARLSGRYVCQNKECQAVYSMVAGTSLAPKNDMICDNCSAPLIRRGDDTEQAVRNRLATNHQHEQGLLDFYKQVGQAVHEINGEKPLEVVFDEFQKTYGLGG